MRGIFTRKTKKAGLVYWIDYIHPIDGTRVRKPLPGVTTESEANRLRAIELADATRQDHGIRPKAKPVLFNGMADEYLKWAGENKGSWKTDEHRAKHLKEFFTSMLMSDISPFSVERYKSSRIRKPLPEEKGKRKEVTKQTVNKEVILGSQIFEKAIEWKKADGPNPFKGKRFKLSKPKKPGSLEPFQVEALMSEITHSVKRDMVEFAFNTGWRISEIRKLKWEDVNQEKGTATIVEPKNKNTVEIELNAVALEVIKRQKEKGLFVFHKKNGDPWKTNLHQTIVRAADRAGVELPPRKAWHILRRTWASMMLQAGCDVETLRQLGNWKDYSMPLWYANGANSDRKRELLNRLPELNSVPPECHRTHKTLQKTANIDKNASPKKVVELGSKR